MTGVMLLMPLGLKQSSVGGHAKLSTQGFVKRLSGISITSLGLIRSLAANIGSGSKGNTHEDIALDEPTLDDLVAAVRDSVIGVFGE